VKRKALVIGSQLGELTGVHNDVETMTALLAKRGFDVDSRSGGNATQAGIRDGYERLIADARSGDAVAVYFSGHGGLALATAPSGIPLPDLQFIVPTDYDEWSPGDFRGITRRELSVLLARLTQRTRNVTVLLDCCHAAHMSRNHDLRVRAWPHPSYLDVDEHLGLLHAQGLQVDLPDAVQNKDAVRVVACAPWESAYEYTNSHGVRTGILTDSLRIALEEAGTARVSWSTLIQRVRNRVSTLALGQRPEAEGPARRLIFDTEEARAGVALAVVLSPPGRLTLPGAALLGVVPGDQFGITPAGVAVASEATIVARATVKQTDGVTVQAEFELCDGYQDLPVLAEAHPLVTSAVRSPVLVHGGSALAEQIRAEVDAVPTLRAVHPDDPVGIGPVLAEVEVGEALTLWDGGREPLASTTPDDAGVSGIVADLRRLGRTAALRRLAPSEGETLADSFTVEWGRVVGGDAEPLPPSGALLHAGEPIYLRLRNDSTRNLFFFVFDLGVVGAVTLITAADPSGLRLRPKQEVVIGEKDEGSLRGSPLFWPAGVPTGYPRPETLLVIVTAVAEDLSTLTHEGVGVTAARNSSPLRRAIAAAVGEATRDWGVAEEPISRYAVVRLDCELSPASAAEPARLLTAPPAPGAPS
jgi:hypothetical protein